MTVSAFGGGIDPNVIRFVVAVAVVAFLVSAIEKVSPAAAWTLVVILLIGLFLFDKSASAALYRISNFVSGGLK